MRTITFKLRLTGEEEEYYQDVADWAVVEDYINLRFENENTSLEIVSDSNKTIDWFIKFAKKCQYNQETYIKLAREE